MRIRQFYLENSAGDRYDLNGRAGVFFSSPEGLGFTLSPSYADLKQGFFRSVSDDTEPQNAVTGTLTFWGADPYAAWQRFINWTASAGQLYLIYCPTGDQEYIKQVSIGYMSKGEKTAVGTLEVGASFTGLTPWYRPDATELSLENSQGNAIRYDYRYTSTLIYGADSASVLSGTIYPGGHVPGSVLLRYFGAILNPKVRLTGNQSGKTYGLCSVVASLEASDVFELSTLYRDSHAHKISASGSVTDLLDGLSLASDPFFHVPVDEPCTISIEADSVFSGSAELQIFYYFRSV